MKRFKILSAYYPLMRWKYILIVFAILLILLLGAPAAAKIGRAHV